MAGAAVLHWRAHADLGRNYSITVLLRERQSLVTDGIYAWIRHPIYASFWLIVIAQPLLVQHWIYGLSGVPAFGLLFFHRLRREEGMMINAFGDQYRDYMRQVGAVIPRRRVGRRAQ
jgi:protein-S-isoprenylcysteine O-methyltransferase Ste14